MSKTKSINEKLFELQLELGGISKDAKNPFFKSKYFDINSLIQQLQPYLEKHRLLLLQPIEEDSVYTKIICLDGTGAVYSSIKLAMLNDPQKMGSQITYYRRYTLGSLLALQAVDDDANLASGNGLTQKPNYPAKPKLKPILKPDSEAFKKAKEYILTGGSVENIKSKYTIESQTEKQLLN